VAAVQVTVASVPVALPVAVVVLVVGGRG
jgi:hypothetical protein